MGDKIKDTHLLSEFGTVTGGVAGLVAIVTYRSIVFAFTCNMTIQTTVGTMRDGFQIYSLILPAITLSFPLNVRA